VGYQFLCYSERLGVVQSVHPTSGPFTAGTTILSSDSFSASNIFNGVDMGVRTEFRYGPVSLEVLGKVAGGQVRHRVNIMGSQQVNVPGAAPVVNQGGLLALSSNIGTFENHILTLVPQVGVNVGWDLTRNVHLFTGYSVLWWPDVMRPGEEVDVGINPGLIPPAQRAPGSPSRPMFLDAKSTIWAQALSVGLEVKY
jgi:hypothetical protein